MKYVVIVMLMCMLVLVCQEAFTDILYLKNGTQREGTVVSQDEKKVVFRIGNEEDGVDVAFLSDEISRIDKIDAEQTMEVSFAKGLKITIAQPIIQGSPLFANLTRPIASGKSQYFDEERVSNGEKTTGFDAQAKRTGDSSLLRDVESEHIAAKDARIRKNLRKYLNDVTNTTQHKGSHH